MRLLTVKQAQKTNTAEIGVNRAPDNKIVVNLNCDEEGGSIEFLSEVQKSDNHIEEAFKRCQPEKGKKRKTWLPFIAKLSYFYVVNKPFTIAGEKGPNFLNDLIAHRDELDLIGSALRKWGDNVTAEQEKYEFR